MFLNTTGANQYSNGIMFFKTANTTGGFNNVAVGRGALIANTTGDSNTAIGRDSTLFSSWCW